MARTLREDIAAEVRAECARQNKSIQEMADVLGLTRPAMSLRMSGKRAFRVEELALIAEALGVPLVALVPTAPTAGAA